MHHPLRRCLLTALVATATSVAVADPVEPPCPAGTPLLRLTPNSYRNGFYIPRGANFEIPSARHISNVICKQPASYPSHKALASMVFQWGQFIDHDITLVTPGVVSFPIPVPLGDPEFDPFNSGVQQIPMTRSHSTLPPFEQINDITSLIDGSNVYGVDEERSNFLRSFSNGELKATAGPDGELPPYNDELSPLDNANENPSLFPHELFVAGDIRCNEQSGLLATHTLFLREHNRLAREIKAANPGLNDETIFQQAKRRLIAYLQVITYQEFLPAVLGDRALPAYTGYQPDTDPCISNEFSTAAFRVGHSMLPSFIPRMDTSNHEHPDGHLSLAHAYFVPHEVADMGITPYLRGLTCIPLESTDQMVVDEVRNLLFGPPGAGGLDLAAINIQRGRDHGLGTYNDVRENLGLTRATSLSHITSNLDLQVALFNAYDGDIDEIDLWVGGMTEDHLSDAILGETFHWLWVDQFRRLRDGDPNWFENTDAATHPDPFSPEELAEIRSTTLGSIIARNTEWNAAESIAAFELPAPELLDFTPNPSSGEITLEWTSFFNAPYEIEASNDLGQTESFEAVMSMTGVDGTTSVTFTDEAAIGQARRFYRVIQK